MTRRATLLALAARVEAAQGADRTLDSEIGATARWLGNDAPEWLRRWSGPFVAAAPGRVQTESGINWAVPAFTASLDAAASLARKAAGFIATMGDIAADGLPGVCLCVSTDPVMHVWGISTGGGEPNERLARAMTAAALRARAEEAPDE